MIAAIIETSTERSIAALYQDDTLLALTELPFGLMSSKFLIPEFDAMLKSHCLTIKDLDWMASGIGPGSYTGMRVGAVIAKTFSYACRIPLVGICSLEGFVPEVEGRFAAVLDAKIGGIYFKEGTKTGNDVAWESGAQVLSVGEVVERLKDVDILVTPYRAPLEKKLAFVKKDWIWEERSPDACMLYQTAKEKYLWGEYTIDGRLELKYLRKVQAEIGVETI